MRKDKKQITYYADPLFKKEIEEAALKVKLSITDFIDEAVKNKVKKVKRM